MTGSEPTPESERPGEAERADEAEYGGDTSLAEPAIGAPGGLGTAISGGPPGVMPGGQAGTTAPDQTPEEPGETSA